MSTIAVTTAKERAEALDKLTHDPEEMERIFIEIADNPGRSLPAIAAARGVSFTLLLHHIKNTTALLDKYNLALEAARERRQAMVIEEFEKIAHVDIRPAYDENGKLKPIHDIPPHIISAIARLEQTEVTIGEITKSKTKAHYYDRIRTLEALGRTLSMFVEKKEVTGVITLEQLVKESMT